MTSHGEITIKLGEMSEEIVKTSANADLSLLKYNKDKIIKLQAVIRGMKTRNKFKKYLSGNKICGLPMFIAKAHIFKSYCKSVFPFLYKCLDYCLKNNLCKGRNVRLPGHVIERYTTYWFSQNKNVKYLSYARLGKFMLSNNVNRFINPTKIPFTFRMYPTIHDY